MAVDTIFALSSGSLPAGVAVIRVSGSEAGRLLAAIAGDLPPPRRAALYTLRDPWSGEAIDRGLVLWMPGPASFTGEDCAELHLHGGRAVVDAMLRVLVRGGGRLAERGEFARRAFHHGKLDLTQIEGLADLIAAETDAQRRQALRASGGELARRLEGWLDRLTGLRAQIEARLDFADEGDVDELAAGFLGEVTALEKELGAALATADAGERIREGFRVAVLGRPNAGKSSLVNAIAGRAAAIVTDEPGTTRDVLEVALDLDGIPVILSDTAGLRVAESAAEREGVRRAEQAGADADLVLWLHEGTGWAGAPEGIRASAWLVRSKADRLPDPGDALAVSALTGAGLAGLLARIAAEVGRHVGDEPALVTRRRQRAALEAARERLRELPGTPDEVAADLLRAASEAIGRLSGRVDVEDVLDRLFAEFCIGK